MSVKGGDTVLENQRISGKRPQSLLVIVSFLRMFDVGCLKENIDKFGFVAQSLGLVLCEKN